MPDMFWQELPLLDGVTFPNYGGASPHSAKRRSPEGTRSLQAGPLTGVSTIAGLVPSGRRCVMPVASQGHLWGQRRCLRTIIIPDGSDTYSSQSVCQLCAKAVRSFQGLTTWATAPKGSFVNQLERGSSCTIDVPAASCCIRPRCLALGVSAIWARPPTPLWICWPPASSSWQVMPLGPTGYGDSPYQGFSALAGNPLLISLEQLIEEGLLAHRRPMPVRRFPARHVDLWRGDPVQAGGAAAVRFDRFATSAPRAAAQATSRPFAPSSAPGWPTTRCSPR